MSLIRLRHFTHLHFTFCFSLLYYIESAERTTPIRDLEMLSIYHMSPPLRKNSLIFVKFPYPPTALPTRRFDVEIVYNDKFTFAYLDRLKMAIKNLRNRLTTDDERRQREGLEWQAWVIKMLISFGSLLTITREEGDEIVRQAGRLIGGPEDVVEGTTIPYAGMALVRRGGGSVPVQPLSTQSKKPNRANAMRRVFELTIDGEKQRFKLPLNQVALLGRGKLPENPDDEVSHYCECWLCALHTVWEGPYLNNGIRKCLDKKGMLECHCGQTPRCQRYHSEFKEFFDNIGLA